ncbi:atp synthase subunit beta [Senna tora]|uniref:Atp synthase subunit beta n=1 Tax=Senna tora TaxID=362788 RepID=A0A834SPS4_9FABA|nr:atp synthase subunit beta [Senna tora]KAF7807877.1 atp synthase subunit beta [Senna tora]KAF7807879.1 atp synthase subunit beta [Senna tora]KAF7807881.1 atp synthase subunit beta [Senna tora]
MNRKPGYGAELRANLDPTKGVGRLRQQDGGHGSRNPLRRGRGGRCKTWGASPGGAAAGADLGGSSKYSNENFEGRRGERFHVNGTCTWPAHPGNGSAGGRVQRLEEHRTSRGVRCAPGGP